MMTAAREQGKTVVLDVGYRMENFDILRSIEISKDTIYREKKRSEDAIYQNIERPDMSISKDPICRETRYLEIRKFRCMSYRVSAFKRQKISDRGVSPRRTTRTLKLVY